MAIAETINQMKSQLSQAYIALASQGATIPENKNLENLAMSIQSVPAGDGENLPALGVVVPANVTYDFDNLQDSFSITFNEDFKEHYLNGDLAIFTGIRVPEAGWPIGDGGNINQMYSWNTEELKCEMNLWNNGFSEYQIVFDAFEDGYRHLTRKIPINYIEPQRVGIMYHLLDVNGDPMDNFLTLDDIKIIDVNANEEVDKKYIRQETDYWTDTFYMTLVPETEYEMKITLQGVEYTYSFITTNYTGDWGSQQLYILPVIRVFSIYPMYQDIDTGYIFNINSASARITQYKNDVEVTSDTVFVGENSKNPDQIYKEMIAGVNRYQVELSAPYFKTEVISQTGSVRNGRYFLAPSFNSNIKKCYILGVHSGDGWTFEGKIPLTESNTTVTFEDGNEGEYTLVNGFVSVLTDIGKPFTISVKEEGYEPIQLRFILQETDPACRSTWFHMASNTEEV